MEVTGLSSCVTEWKHLHLFEWHCMVLGNAQYIHDHFNYVRRSYSMPIYGTHTCTIKE